jgi:hypothetical protein
LSLPLLGATALGLSLWLFGRLVGFTSPWFAALAMIEFLGLVRIARPLVHLKVPRAMREVRGWELKGDVHRVLGVQAFGGLLRRTPLRLLNPHVYVEGRTDGRASGCAAAAAECEAAEAAHLWAIVVTGPYLLCAGFQGWWNALFSLLAVHVAVNLYPVLHLRLVRGRLERLCWKLRSTRDGSRQAGRVRPTS